MTTGTVGTENCWLEGSLVRSVIVAKQAGKLGRDLLIIAADNTIR